MTFEDQIKSGVAIQALTGSYIPLGDGTVVSIFIMSKFLTSPDDVAPATLAEIPGVVIPRLTIADGREEANPSQ